jgi:hypothetical protein
MRKLQPQASARLANHENRPHEKSCTEKQVMARSAIDTVGYRPCSTYDIARGGTSTKTR